MALKMPFAPDVLRDMREQLQEAADLRIGWVRTNLAAAMDRSGIKASTVAEMTGVAIGTVKGFLTGTDTSVGNAVRICLATGFSLTEMAQPPKSFRRLLDEKFGPAQPLKRKGR